VASRPNSFTPGKDLPVPTEQEAKCGVALLEKKQGSAWKMRIPFFWEKILCP